MVSLPARPSTTSLGTSAAATLCGRPLTVTVRDPSRFWWIAMTSAPAVPEITRAGFDGAAVASGRDSAADRGGSVCAAARHDDRSTPVSDATTRAKARRLTSSLSCRIAGKPARAPRWAARALHIINGPTAALLTRGRVGRQAAAELTLVNAPVALGASVRWHKVQELSLIHI